MDVLVLNNLKWRIKNYRFIDIKIGQMTADVGWQGKSYIESLPNWFVDSITTSNLEFLRLEGMDNPPLNLEQWFKIKKFDRLMLQMFRTRL